MSEAKRLVAAIVKFLDDQRSSGCLTEDAAESLEVASQCLQSAYEVGPEDTEENVDLLQLFSSSAPPLKKEANSVRVPPPSEALPQDKEEADKKKAEGNELMKQEMYEDAINCYSKSIELDSTNAVYYCNRAAALLKINENEKALKDCEMALQIDPNYSKAHGRKGFAHSALNEHRDARDSFLRALELDPTNISYQNNLEVAEQKIREAGGAGAAGGFGGMGMGGMGGMDFTALFNNPALMNMATSMMANPQMQNMMANVMHGANTSQEGQAGMGNLLQVGQQLAQQMQQSNPELVDQLRNQMRDSQNPDGGSA